MAKRTRGPALLELIQKQDGSNVRVPAWWQKSAPLTQQRAAAAPRTIPKGDATQPQGSVSTIEAEPEPPLVAIQGDHVVISLSSVSAGLVLFIMIALLGWGFFLGWRTGDRQGMEKGYRRGVESIQANALDEIEAARSSTPNTRLFENVGTSPITDLTITEQPKSSAQTGSEPTTGGDSTGWIVGHTYIVVQEFKADDKDDATKARLFLGIHGIETSIIETTGKYGYILVAAKSFNRDDPVQRKWCDDYHERIRQVGRLFVKAGGRYDLQGYPKTYTRDGW